MKPDTQRYVLNHYDHRESVAAGRRIFSEKVSGSEVVDVGLDEFARGLGAGPQEIERLLCQHGFRINPIKPKRRGWDLMAHVRDWWRLAGGWFAGDSPRPPVLGYAGMVFACPKCGGGSFDLAGDAPEHDIFSYLCRACQTRFRPVDSPRPPVRVEPPPRQVAEAAPTVPTPPVPAPARQARGREEGAHRAAPACAVAPLLRMRPPTLRSGVGNCSVLRRRVREVPRQRLPSGDSPGYARSGGTRAGMLKDW